MKELKLYAIGVNTRGPYAYTKSGSGMWYVCETSEKRAEKALQQHLNDHNLIGSSSNASCIDPKYVALDTDILPRKECMLRKDYEQALFEKKVNSKKSYTFSPAKTEKGLLLHRKNKQPEEMKEVKVFGAFKKDSSLEMVDDCIPLKDVEGVTINGRPLSSQNLENVLNELE